MKRHSARDRRARTAWIVLWLPGILVALGAGVATAHGLYEVAIAAQVPAELAWLYPLITDGLALVAYAATTRLSGPGRGYAWTVVVLAAGLSGLAQAIYLAGGVGAATGVAQTAVDSVRATAPTGGAPAAVRSAPAVLRFGVGAWPAIAAAIVAHLLFILSTEARPDNPSDDRVSDAAAVQDLTDVQASADVQPDVQPSTEHPAAQRSTVAAAVQPAERPTPQDGPSNEQAGAQRSTVAAVVQPIERSTTRSRPSTEHGTVSNAESPARDRARAAARRHAHRHGQLPTVSQLMAMADVARGTAGNALKELRDQPPPLQVVHDNDPASADQ